MVSTKGGLTLEHVHKRHECRPRSGIEYDDGGEVPVASGSQGSQGPHAAANCCLRSLDLEDCQISGRHHDQDVCIDRELASKPVSEDRRRHPLTEETSTWPACAGKGLIPKERNENYVSSSLRQLTGASATTPSSGGG